MKRCYIVIREEQTIPVEELRDSRNEVWVTINPDLKEPKYDLRREYILSNGKCYMWNVAFSFNLIPGQGYLFVHPAIIKAGLGCENPQVPSRLHITKDFKGCCIRVDDEDTEMYVDIHMVRGKIPDSDTILSTGVATKEPLTMSDKEFLSKLMSVPAGKKAPVLVDTNPVSHIDNLLRKVYDNEL